MNKEQEVSVEADNAVRKVSLICNSCGGALSVDEGSQVLMCPFCGAKEMLLESEAVQIEKIRSESYKEIQIAKIKSAERLKLKAQEQKNKEKEQAEANKFKKRFSSKLLIVGFVLCVLVSLLFFVDFYVVSGVLAILQALCFAAAWLMGMRIIKDKTHHLHTVCVVVAIILIFPVLGNIGNETVLVGDTDWNIIFLKDEIPEPNSKKFDINDNSEVELWLDIYNVPEEDYYNYVLACKELGYEVEAQKNNNSYEAYNAEGYCIYVSYYRSGSEMTLKLDAPAELSALNWDSHTVSKVLPKPPSEVGTYTSESKDSTTVIVGDITKDQYFAYCDTCREKGFNIEETGYETSFTAFSEDGYKLNIKYTAGNRQMKMTLDFPMNFTPIIWPQYGIGAMIPAPPSLSGKVAYDNKNSYSVYIENMTPADYEEYVQQCIAAGFNKDMNRYDNSYNANNSTGEKLRITYKGNNVIYIDLYGHYDKDYLSES